MNSNITFQTDGIKVDLKITGLGLTLDQIGATQRFLVKLLSPSAKKVKVGAEPRLVKVGDNFIPAIKILREHTGWGLGDTKAFCDVVRNVNTPLPLPQVSDINALVKELRDIGCEISDA